MNNFITNQTEFIKMSLNNFDRISVQKDGSFEIESNCQTFWRFITGRKNKRMIGLNNAMIELYNDLETKKINHPDEELIKIDTLAKKILDSKRNKSPKKRELELRQIAFKEKYLRTKKKTNLFELYVKATNWKQSIPFYNNSALTEEEKNALKPLSEYPEFLEYILINETVRHSFFKWTLEQANPAGIFILFPNLTDSLSSCHLSKALGYLRQLKLSEDKKNVTALFVNSFGESEPLSIIDPNTTITLQNNYTLSLKDIYAQYKLKDLKPTESRIDIFKNGIQNWNPSIQGRYNPNEKKFTPQNLDDTWLEQIPPQETLTRDEIMKKFHLDELEKNESLFIQRATRKDMKLRMENTHAFYTLARPIENGDKYNLYTFGAYAKKTPQTLVEKLSLLTGTFEATFINDQAMFYSSFELAYKPHRISEELCQKVMTVIKKQIQLVRTGKMAFQYLTKNCAYRVNEAAKKAGIQENPYETNIWLVKPKNFILTKCLKYIENGSKYLDKIKKVTLYIFSKKLTLKEDQARSLRTRQIIWLLGGSRKNSKFPDDGSTLNNLKGDFILQPSKLFNTRELVVSYGHLNPTQKIN